MVTPEKGSSSSPSNGGSPHPCPAGDDGDANPIRTSRISANARAQRRLGGGDKMGDGELGIFGAERYFNGGFDEAFRRPANGAPRCRHGKDPGILPGTPSIRSTSSCNSQNALLKKKAPSGPSRRRSGREQGRRFLPNLGCNCNCSDTKSVTVSTIEEQRNEREARIRKGEMRGDDLGVFGSPVLEQGAGALRLNNFSWRAAAAQKGGEGAEIMEASNGNESDASSDLFEIESLAGKHNPFPAATDGCATPPTGYAPSEASVQWSVATASAGECEEAQPPAAATPDDPRKTPSAAPGLQGGEAQRRHGGGLLGCRSYKAVEVAGSEQRAVGRTNSMPTSYRSMEAFGTGKWVPAENRAAGFLGLPQGPHALSYAGMKGGV